MLGVRLKIIVSDLGLLISAEAAELNLTLFFFSEKHIYYLVK